MLLPLNAQISFFLYTGLPTKDEILIMTKNNLNMTEGQILSIDI